MLLVYAAFLLMQALHALYIQQALQALLMQALQALCIQPLAEVVCECAHRHCVSVTAISTAISRSRYPGIRTTLYTGINTSLYTAITGSRSRYTNTNIRLFTQASARLCIQPLFS